ncbi:hypothetical protein B0F90DRAFT_1669175 [Multifurca ochricompacta]|uniref:Uncharacterized protein n=1 Tax=Multifurca ochricompacta TaxID=376703 RepID=A0AAD4QM86_9AGAM|nr:hypothetical protein B0F90DRAFT_1669175 [Multifurca ochricompacta]
MDGMQRLGALPGHHLTLPDSHFPNLRWFRRIVTRGQRKKSGASGWAEKGGPKASAAGDALLVVVRRRHAGALTLWAPSCRTEKHQRGPGSWLRAARSREVGAEGLEREEDGDEEEMSVTVPKKGIRLVGWETSIEEESDEEGPIMVVFASSVVLEAGLSSLALPFGLEVVLDDGEEGWDGMRVVELEDSASCDSSCSGWSGSIPEYGRCQVELRLYAENLSDCEVGNAVRRERTWGRCALGGEGADSRDRSCDGKNEGEILVVVEWEDEKDVLRYESRKSEEREEGIGGRDVPQEDDERLFDPLCARGLRGKVG